MAKRLGVLYPLGTAVEILQGRQWQPAQVIRHAFPAVWVRTADAREWFVTNRQRIRQIQDEG